MLSSHARNYEFGLNIHYQNLTKLVPERRLSNNSKFLIKKTPEFFISFHKKQIQSINKSKVELEGRLAQGKRQSGTEGKGNTTLIHNGGRRQYLFLLAVPLGMQLKELPNLGAASSSNFPLGLFFWLPSHHE